MLFELFLISEKNCLKLTSFEIFNQHNFPMSSALNDDKLVPAALSNRSKIFELIASRNKLTKLERNADGWRVDKWKKLYERARRVGNCTTSIVSAPERRAKDRIRASRIPLNRSNRFASFSSLYFTGEPFARCTLLVRWTLVIDS